jgi:hypothetical protein
MREKISMHLTTPLSFAVFQALVLIDPASAQEPAARQDVPATTGTIFQSQPSTTGHGQSVVVVPGTPSAEQLTTNSTSSSKPSGLDQAAPNSRANGGEAR